MSTQALPRSKVEPAVAHRQTWLQQHGESLTIYISFAVFVFIIGVPFYYIFVSSITPRSELFQIPPRYWPSSPTLENFVKMADGNFWLFFRNSLIFAIGSSVVSVGFSALAAYALARLRFPGSNIVYMG